MQKADLKAALVPLIAEGSPESVADAMILAATTPIDPTVALDPGAVTAEGSRDETHDSVDPITGTLTADAVVKRAAAKAADDVADAELAVVAAEEADDEAKLADAKDRLAAAQARADATQADLDALGPAEPDGDAGGAMVTADPNDPAISDDPAVVEGAGVVNTTKSMKADKTK